MRKPEFFDSDGNPFILGRNWKTRQPDRSPSEVPYITLTPPSISDRMTALNASIVCHRIGTLCLSTINMHIICILLKYGQGRNWLVLIGKHRALFRVSRTRSNGHFETFWSKMVRTVLMQIASYATDGGSLGADE